MPKLNLHEEKLTIAGGFSDQIVATENSPAPDHAMVEVPIAIQSDIPQHDDQLRGSTTSPSRGWKRAKPKDPWIITSHTGVPPLPDGRESNLQWVWELLEDGGRKWNTQLLKTLFNENDCACILKINTLDPGKKDRWVWIKGDNQEFTVAKAYSKMVNDKFNNLDIAEGSKGAGTLRKIRTRSWKLNIKGKLKHFLWKCYSDVLPTKTKLRKKGLLVDCICQTCGEDLETIEHIFFKCKKAREMWKAAPVNWELTQVPNTSFKQWWIDVCSVNKLEVSEARIELTTYLLWWLWKARNLWVFKKAWMPVPVIIQMAQRDWLEFSKRNCSTKWVGQ
ncbi:Unknown protein [Striga hermonthica]|uniref:Reverse transcriptase zinc-binding domain-containing protein n=2 Tax=Striga hermonthica TaxID=68872 RepID=A0A9N7NYX6_STRHE|nr:Unknown protein [Striga hermonthica]